MTVELAFDNLAAKNVAGIVNNFDYRALPDLLLPGILPVKIVLPDDTYYDGVRIEGFDTDVVNVTVWARVRLVLSYMPVIPGGRMAQVPVFIDRFISSLAGDWLLGDALAAPLYIEALSSGVVSWASEQFVGIDFRLRMVVRIS